VPRHPRGSLGACPLPSSSQLAYTGETNQTFLDTASLQRYRGRVQRWGGDAIHLTTDTVSDALAHTRQVNGGADSLIALRNDSTIRRKRVSHIDNGLFAWRRVGRRQLGAISTAPDGSNSLLGKDREIHDGVGAALSLLFAGTERLQHDKKN
jgi:hypothetical protein